MYYAAITLTILSSTCYHLLLKLTPKDIHPTTSLMVTYALAAAICGVFSIWSPLKAGFFGTLRQLNWASYLLALPLVGLEMGFLLAYRAGWRVGITPVVVTVAAAILLIPVGLIAFKEKTSLLNVGGMLLAIVGLVMMNTK